jgi:uroporphyrinogen III methyltransferase/synthase
MLTGSADCIAFMSSSSVKNLGLLFDTYDLSEKLQGLSVACIGDVTAATAADYGLHVDIQPEETTAAGLANAIAEYYSRHK